MELHYKAKMVMFVWIKNLLLNEEIMSCNNHDKESYITELESMLATLEQESRQMRARMERLELENEQAEIKLIQAHKQIEELRNQCTDIFGNH